MAIWGEPASKLLNQQSGRIMNEITSYSRAEIPINVRIEKLEKYFGDKQIIATTHSPIIIQNMDKKYLYDLEDLVGVAKPCQPV